METQERPVTILIAALGGEGGGVLTDWIVEAAKARGLPVQSTSIPGVAQRTGATTYYIEVFPRTHAELGGRRPLMALSPSPGDVDLMIASELLEAGRAVENGFVTPDRTTLVAATHRVYAISEKAAMGDGRYDETRVLRAVREMAKRPILFDPKRAPGLGDLPLNAVLLGAAAAAGILPIPVEVFRQGIRDAGIAVDGNLAGFEAGLTLAGAGVAQSFPARPDASPAQPAAKDLHALLRQAAHEMPAGCIAIVEEGVRRTSEYQDTAYAARYLDGVRRVLAVDRGSPLDGSHRLTSEAARHLALWMTYQDVIRVADLKSRQARLAQVRDEVRAKPGEPVRVTEFFKPGIEEISAILPGALGGPLYRWAERRNLLDRWHMPMHVSSTSITGYLRLRLLAGLRPLRPRSFRFGQEMAGIERWLSAVVRSAALDYGLALQTAACAGLLKGYSDTFRRGHANFQVIFDGVVEPFLDGRLALADPAETVRRAREAALADPERRALEQFIAATRGREPRLGMAAE